MEKTKEITDLVVELDDFEKIKQLEKGSALTIEGVMLDEKGVKDILDFFKEALIKKEPTIYCIKGDTMNRYCDGLAGKKAYPEGLNIAVIGLDNFNAAKLMELRLKYFGLFRWLDDVCDNNRRRNK